MRAHLIMATSSKCIDCSRRPARYAFKMKPGNFGKLVKTSLMNPMAGWFIPHHTDEATHCKQCGPMSLR